METKIAILRGINVGGKRRIVMSDLKMLLEKSGFENVKTYIQSGNVIFESEQDNSVLANDIKKIIKENFGFDVPTIVRNSEYFEQIVDSNPFYNQENEISKLHLTFLSEQPTKDSLKELESYDYSPDIFVIKDRSIFIYCEGKYHQSKLTNNFFEKKLGVEATTRNWKTVLKLLTLTRCAF